MQRKSITRPIYSTFTSTPRQKSNWPRERLSILPIKKPDLNDSYETDDDSTASTSVNRASNTGRRRRSISRRFSIISKQRPSSAMTSMIYKNRLDYREKNHSKRLRVFEKSREFYSQMNNDDDDFQMLKCPIDLSQQSQLFPLDMPSERFEILAKHTTSEHPYSNEPTAIEASESSLLSSSFCQSKTMSSITIYGKIPRIKANEQPQRELIQSHRRSSSLLLNLMDFTKHFIFILILMVVYASYAMSKFFFHRNE